MSDDLAARLARSAKEREQEAARVLDRAIRLREAIYRLFSGPGATATDLATLNDELGQGMTHARVVRTGPKLLLDLARRRRPGPPPVAHRPLCRQAAHLP
jgi:predicted RNA-binding Zn ribbon-like protein